MRRAFLSSFPAALLVLCTLGVGAKGASAAAATQEMPGLHNFIAATTNVFSGSQPEGDAAFAALAKLGVKTLISVDGAQPDGERAAKHGLNYVHLPIGYDGIPTNRVAELAKAAAILPGPVYVHCHHGKHRGPAAVAVICLADEDWTKTRAEEFLHAAGTGAEYAGLYRAVSNFVPPTAAELASVSTNFPSITKMSSLVAAMVAIDGIFENLKSAQRAGWQTPAGHSDIAPEHESLMLVEQYRELARTADTAERPKSYRLALAGALRTAEALQLQFSLSATNTLDLALKSVGQSCVNCHERYRNE